MMSFPDVILTSTLLIANAALLAAGTIAVQRFLKQAERMDKFWDSPTGSALAEERSEPARPAADPELERRVAELQSVVKTLAKQQRSTVKTSISRLPIDNAMRMAQHGASIDDLIRSCGLNIGEAQLMRKLHGHSTKEPAVSREAG